jgi:patatin-related protein
MSQGRAAPFLERGERLAVVTDAGALPGEAKELRLALVLYGGVSLAVYMHGVAKELHRLLRASALLEAGISPGRPSERAYCDLLLTKAGREGVRTRVVLDAVSGTSAGGINGVYLAKALAHDRPQEALRDLWLTRGDVAQLVRGPSWLPWRLRAVLALRGIGRRAPLRGDAMARWLFEALELMDAAPDDGAGLGSLMPRGHELELFVTATDFHGYNRAAPAASPPSVVERRHRHVFRFSYRSDGAAAVDELGRDANAALAFAARVTASFPGAFPPVSVARFEEWTGAGVGGHHEQRLFRQYGLAGASARRTFFVDGGVLDNRPFGHVIAAIRRRPASVEVDRRLLYVEPDPGKPRSNPDGREPGIVEAVLGSVAGLPRADPILDDLLEVARHNERVERVRAVVQSSFERISARVDATVGAGPDALAAGDEAALEQWGRSLHAAALDEAGLAYGTYVRAKTSGVLDAYAGGICRLFDYPADSDHAFVVRAAIRAWAARKGLLEQSLPPAPEQIRFLVDFDLPYRIRRLGFVIAGLNGWYGRVGALGFPARAELDRVKARLYAAIRELRETMASALGPDVQGLVAGLFGEAALADVVAAGLGAAEDLAEGREAELDALREACREALARRLAGAGARLVQDVDRLTRGWPPELRRELAARYVGFPLWDVVLYPLQLLADAGERDRVDVVRLSPDDATLLGPPGGGSKLRGTRLGHFGAFFNRADRENDYLWGRLDGAEHAVRLLVAPDGVREGCRAAFAAILEEEAGSLPLAGALVEHVRAALAHD